MSGGEFYLNAQNGVPVIEVDYWHPGLPSSSLLEALQADTVGQLEDGIGENGFRVELDGKQLLVYADCNQPPAVDQVDDGRNVVGPSKIAIAARDGDLARLAEEIKASPQDINRLHQGATALYLATLYGHANAVRQLLAAGANPNFSDSDGSTPLKACALSRHLDDERSRDIGQMLLDAGADPTHQQPNGESAKSYAELRGKKLLAAIL